MVICESTQELVAECMPFFELLQKRATRPPVMALPPPPLPAAGTSAEGGETDAEGAKEVEDGDSCATHAYQARAAVPN